jgi:hypothetical protein
MPFLTTTDIATEVTPSNYVERLLVQIQVELETKGMTFDTPTLVTTKLTPEKGEYESIFYTYWFGGNTVVSLKDNNGSSQTLTIDKDCKLIPHPNITGYYNGVELQRNGCVKKIKDPHYLELSTYKGLYIDFSDNNSTNATLLKNLIIDFLIKMTKFKQTDYQNITQAGTGNSRVTFESAGEHAYYSEFLKDPEFNSIMKTYFRI